MQFAKSLVLSFALSLCVVFSTAFGGGFQRTGRVCHLQYIAGNKPLKTVTKALIDAQGSGHYIYIKVIKDERGNENAVYLQTSAKSTRDTPEEKGNYVTALVGIDPSPDAIPMEAVLYGIHEQTDMTGASLRDATFLFGPSLLRSDTFASFRQKVLRNGNFRILAEDTSNDTDPENPPEVFLTAAVDNRAADEPLILKGLKQVQLEQANSLIDDAAQSGLRLAVSTIGDSMTIENGTLVLPLKRSTSIRPFLVSLSQLNESQRRRVVDDLLSHEKIEESDFDELIASATSTDPDSYDDMRITVDGSNSEQFLGHPEVDQPRPLETAFDKLREFGRFDASELTDMQLLNLGVRLKTSWGEAHRVLKTGIEYHAEDGSVITSAQRSNTLEDWKRVSLLADGSVENVRGARESVQRVKSLETLSAPDSDVVVELVHNDGDEALAGIRQRASNGQYKGKHVALLICPLDGRRLLDLRNPLFENGALSFTLPIPLLGADHVDAPTATLVMTECRENPAIRTSRTPGLFVRAAARSVRQRVARALQIESEVDRASAVLDIFERYGEGPFREALPLSGGADTSPGSTDVRNALRELDVRLELFEKLLIELVLDTPPAKPVPVSARRLLAASSSSFRQMTMDHIF